MKLLATYLLACATVAAVSSAGIRHKPNRHKPNGGRRSRGRGSAISPWDFFNRQVNKKAKAKSTAVPTPKQPKPTPVKVGEMPEQFRLLLSKMKTPDGVLKHLGVTKSMMEARIGARGNPLWRGVAGGSSENNLRGQNINDLVKQSYCGPHLEKYELPQTQLHLGMYWPYAFRVARCSGAVGMVNSQECIPKRTAQVNYTTYWIHTTGNVAYETRTVPITVHLECEEACQKKAHDCDAVRHVYDNRTCSCKCKDAYSAARIGHTCGRRLNDHTRYDASECKCVCALQHNHCKVLKQIWDVQACACVCPKNIRCRAGYQMNKRSCECQVVAGSPWDLFGGK